MSLGSKKIRINAIAPGNIFFKGSVWEKINANKRKTLNYIKENVPMRQLGNPEDISELCLYLSSNKLIFNWGNFYSRWRTNKKILNQ